MSRWIRGRLGRPMASIICMFMLVSLLMPLAPPPVQAQGDGIDWSALTDGVQAEPVPLAVIDFQNKSDYTTGLLGRNMASSISLALQDTGKYSIVPRKDVESLMQELNLTVPMGQDAQAMLADRLGAPFAVSGDITSVKIVRDQSGTYAEVGVDTLVISKITRLPINGARILAKSSPKIGYISNTDALVYEAIATAGYQTAQRILDSRIPMATVLMADPSGGVRLRGGKMIGLQSGMSLVAVRQESVTGIMRVDSVNYADATCTITHNYRGVASNDRVVPVFSLEGIAASPKAKRSKVGQHVATVLGIAALAALIGHSQSDAQAPSVSAVPLADAAVLSTLYSDGGNLIRWGDMGKNIAFYIVYRVANGDSYPIAVLPKGQNYYVDYYNPLIYRDVPDGKNADGTDKFKVEITSYKVTYDIELAWEDHNTPTVNISNTIEKDTWDATDTPPDTVTQYEVTIDDAGATVTCLATMPNLVPGESCAYRVQPVFYVYDTGAIEDGIQFPSTYVLRQGEMSAETSMVTLTPPPIMVAPADGQPLDGQFAAMAFSSEGQYVMQISKSPTFPADITETRIATVRSDSSQGITLYQAEVFYDLTDMLGSTTLALDDATSVYVRFGVKPLLGPEPKALSSSNSYYNGYVFSKTRQFSLSLTMVGRSNSESGMNKFSPIKAPLARPDSRRLRR